MIIPLCHSEPRSGEESPREARKTLRLRLRVTFQEYYTLIENAWDIILPSFTIRDIHDSLFPRNRLFPKMVRFVRRLYGRFPGNGRRQHRQYFAADAGELLQDRFRAGAMGGAGLSADRHHADAGRRPPGRYLWQEAHLHCRFYCLYDRLGAVRAFTDDLHVDRVPRLS